MVPEMVLFCTAPDTMKLNKMHIKKITLSALVLASLALFTNCSQNGSAKTDKSKPVAKADTTPKKAGDTTVAAAAPVTYPPINHAQYDSLMKKMAHGDTTGKWPVKNAPYPLPGAILPYKRIVAFYGNLYAKRMGILGEIPPKEML